MESGEKKRFFQEADVVSDNRPVNWDITCLKLSNECPKGITSPRSPYFFTEKTIILEMHRDKMFVRLNPNKSRHKRSTLPTILQFLCYILKTYVRRNISKFQIIKQSIINHDTSFYRYGNEDKERILFTDIIFVYICKNRIYLRFSKNEVIEREFHSFTIKDIL